MQTAIKFSMASLVIKNSQLSGKRSKALLERYMAMTDMNPVLKTAFILLIVVSDNCFIRSTVHVRQVNIGKYHSEKSSMG